VPVRSVIVTSDTVPGRDGAPDIHVLIYRPQGAAGPLPLLFHIHRGGYVSGSPESQTPRNSFFAQDIGCLVISVAYRRRPETIFPGSLEDCYAALHWAFHNADALGIDPSRIAIGGQSAGGGLTAALCLLARDRKEIPVAFQLLVYPMLDDRTGAANEVDPQKYAGEFCWTAANNHFGWASMLGGEPGGPDVTPYASPARAADLSGLPPTLITVGALDLFVVENIEYARRFIRAGVPTELHVYPGGFHGLDGSRATIMKRCAGHFPAAAGGAEFVRHNESGPRKLLSRGPAVRVHMGPSRTTRG
jgi:acetyl esterase/lipase